MPEPLSQRDSRWKDTKLGTSDYTLGTHGCTVTSLAMLLGLTPDVVNEKIKSVQGFQAGSLVIWSKLQEAFPQIKSATRYKVYDNDVVKNNLPCLIEVDGSRIGATMHWVLYTGNGQMIDPWTGVVKATSYYPAVGSAVIVLNPNYNPSEEKLYTEAQMTAMREQRDANHRLYEGERTAHDLTKTNHNSFIETLANLYGSVKSEESIVKFATENSKVIDERNEYKDKWEREVLARKEDYEKHQEELKTLKDEIERLQKQLNTLKPRIDQAIEKSDEAKEKIEKDQIEPSQQVVVSLLIKKVTEFIKKLLRIK